MNIACFWAALNGHLVLFYEAVSQVVDWLMIENWFNANCDPSYDKNTRRAHTDAQNFHIVLEFVSEA